MNKVLIDNATISSVQRALGKAPIKDPALLDIEHVSLARFCEYVLLSDKIIVPDNYKTELTSARKALLNNDLFSFEPMDKNEDSEILTISSSMTKIWAQAFEAGSDRSLFSQYFKQINAFSKLIWEHSSSEFFLVFRAMGIDKESPLIEAVLASRSDEVLGKELRIVGTDGKPVHWDKLSRHLQRMLSVMGWIGHQYIWHQVFSAQHDCFYAPHPLRDFFSYDFLNRINVGAKNANDFTSAFTKGLETFEQRVYDSLEQLGAIESSETYNLPLFLPLLIRECENKNDFLDVLFQIREESEVVELREMLKEIQSSISLGDYKPLSKMAREIEKVGANILKEKGIQQNYINLSPPTTIIGINLTGEDTGIDLPIPSALYKQYFLNRKYRAFVKRTMDELAMPSQYGVLKDKLNSFAWIQEDKYPNFYLKEDRLPSKFHKEFSASELK